MCSRCGLPFAGAITTDFECPNCSAMKIYFDRAVASLRFQGVVRHAILALKYGKQLHWGRVMQGWVLARAQELLGGEELDLALPVPLHRLRQRERGFNQAWLLLEALGPCLDLSCHRDLLHRVRATDTQSALDRSERLVNLRGAFALRQPGSVKGQRILLIDDVLTTGSTANECARVLKQSGARSVLVFTLARSLY